MDEEIHAIKKNDTWKLTNPLENKKAIGVKRLYKTKKNAKGEEQRYKARLVTKGYKQRKTIERKSIYQIKVHAWYDISRLSLKERFVEPKLNLEGQGR